MERSEMEVLVLAALLHDIGKFAQRAKRPRSDQHEGEYCPIYNGRPSHLHVLYTDHFVEKDLPLPLELEASRSRIARIASAHHKPAGDDLLEQALCHADRLSAGMDRAAQEEDSGDYMTARLISTFAQVRLTSRASELTDRYYPLAPIDADPFPVDLASARSKSYAALFELFLADLRDGAKLPLDMGVRHFIASLSSLLEKYTWCIPSSTYRNEPDISLYDHAVTTAAIAQALASFHADEGGMPGTATRTAEKFVLLGGDLSGIQAYIFGIEKSHGAGVAKMLRARSFHLQALTHSFILSLLEKTGLLPQAKIMDAGGRFVLLLPATRRILELLPAMASESQEWFLRTFKGRLALNLSYDIRLKEAGFDLASFHEKLDDLFDQLESAKLRKFDLVLATGRSPFAESETEDFTLGACAVCRVNAVTSQAVDRHEKVSGRHLDLCDLCEAQINSIGRKLPQKESAYAIFSRTQVENAFQLFGGLSLRFADKPGKKDREALDIMNLRSRSGFSHHAVAGHLPRFAEGDDRRWIAEGRRAGSEESVVTGEPKTFNQLGQEARLPDGGGKLRGKAFLAALKADVDNLGLIFSIGLQEKLSISRFAGLSRMLNHFFAEHMVSRIQKDYPDLYVVFAGGDDVFLIGPWHDLLHFSETLTQEFRRFVAGNADISLSAGIFVTKPTLPTNTVARNASELLDQSKRYKRSGKSPRTKDAVTLFGVTTGWEEFSTLLLKGKWLEDLVMDEKIPSGLAMRLLRYAEDCKDFRSGKGGRRSGMYRSHMRYDFARNLNAKLPSADREELESLGTDPTALEQMRLPISYAMYRIRTE